MVEMELVGVRLEVPANSPIVLLREKVDRPRVLPIYIGGPEAAAIAYALEGVVTPRPLTHDLFKNLLDELAVSLRRVVVTELREHTFFAELELVLGGSVHRLSSRPSDAIALAARTGTPIFCAEAVLDECARRPEEDEPAEEADGLVDEFREFIENVSPDDFAG